MHQPAKPIDIVFATAQGGFGDRALRSIDKIRIERLRKPLPEAPLRRLVLAPGGSSTGMTLIALSPIIRFLTPNLLSIAYEFETARRPTS